MKLIDKDAVLAEIERKRDAALTRQRNLEAIGQVTVLNETLARELSRIISFINTLEVKEVQEEPVNEDLEEAAVGVGLRFRDELICDGVSREAAEIYAAIAQQKFMDGAQWKENQFMKDAIVTCMQEDDLGDLVPTIEDMSKKGFKHGDKVKVIIIKEEQI